MRLFEIEPSPGMLGIIGFQIIRKDKLIINKFFIFIISLNLVKCNIKIGYYNGFL